jgi:enoyl-CoA hydratase/carnithine racemase
MMAAKRAIDHGVALGIEEGLDIEAREFAALFGGKEQVAGMTSFIENGPGKAVFE